MSNAIHPDVFKQITELKTIKAATTTDQAEQEEKLLAALATTGGWDYLKIYIQDLSTALDTLVKSSMESGASLEEIGLKTMVSELAKSLLVRVIEKVEDARSAVEQPE